MVYMNNENKSLAFLNAYPNMLSIAHISEILDISKDKAYRMAKEGDFASMKLGRLIKVPKSEFIDYLVHKVAKIKKHGTITQ